MEPDRRDDSPIDRRRLLPRDGGRRANDRSEKPGFACPFCQFHRTRVSDSLPRPNRRGYRRRRYCERCKKKFWTFEAVEAA